MKKWIIIASLFCIIQFISAVYAEEKMRIAVLDLSPTGVPANTAKTISSMLRTEIIDSGKFTVVERDQMEAILKEQGLQQTGCTDAACAVQIGKLISAKKMLIGDVSKLGKAYIIACRIVDVEKGVAEYATQETAENEDELVATTRRMVVKLLKRMDVAEASWVTEHSPYGIYLAYNQLIGTSEDFEDLYSPMFGVSVGYIYSYNAYLAFTGDINFLMRNDKIDGDARLILNSYSVGARTGLYLHEKFYPYIGIAVKGTFIRESDKHDSANFFGYGADALGGFYLMFVESIGIFGQYNFSLGRVNDEDGTDISGHLICAGVLYKL